MTVTDLKQHEVLPCGKLRFALTCRYIDPKTIEDKKQREYAEIAGKLP